MTNIKPMENKDIVLYSEIIQTEHEIERLQEVYNALDKYTDDNPCLEYCEMFGRVGLDLQREKRKLTRLKCKRYGKQRH